MLHLKEVSLGQVFGFLHSVLCLIFFSLNEPSWFSYLRKLISLLYSRQFKIFISFVPKELGLFFERIASVIRYSSMLV